MSVRRRLLAAAVAALVTTGLPAPAQAASPMAPALAAPRVGPTDILSGFMLVNGNSRRCLTVTGRADNDLAVQRPCQEAAAFMWRFRLATWTGLFQIQNVRSGRCLTIAGGAITNNARVVQYRCDSDLSRRWRLLDGPGETFFMRNADSGRCLTTSGNTVAAVQFTCDNHRSRRWNARLLGGNRS